MFRKFNHILIYLNKYYIHKVISQNQNNLKDNRSFMFKHLMFLNCLDDKMCIDYFNHHMSDTIHCIPSMLVIHCQLFRVCRHMNFLIEFLDLDHCTLDINCIILHNMYNMNNDKLKYILFIPMHSGSCIFS